MNMKKKLCMAGLAVVILLSGVHAQSSGDTLYAYYHKLATSKAPEDRETLSGKLYGLLQTDREKDWLMAWQLFGTMKKKN